MPFVNSCRRTATCPKAVPGEIDWPEGAAPFTGPFFHLNREKHNLRWPMRVIKNTGIEFS